MASKNCANTNDEATATSVLVGYCAIHERTTSLASLDVPTAFPSGAFTVTEIVDSTPTAIITSYATFTSYASISKAPVARPRLYESIATTIVIILILVPLLDCCVTLRRRKLIRNSGNHQYGTLVPVKREPGELLDCTAADDELNEPVISNIDNIESIPKY
jgi:hypothetical protein